MTPAITLPPLPIREISQHAEASARELAQLDEILERDEVVLNEAMRGYALLCRTADELGDLGQALDDPARVDDPWATVDEQVRTLWSYSCEWFALDLRQLAKYRQWPRDRYNDTFIAGVSRHAERLAEFLRTMAVVWEELELETPDEIYESVWTVRISPLTYLRAMWNLFWSSIRHPFSETVIELKTGRILLTG